MELVKQGGDMHWEWPNGCAAWKRQSWRKVVAKLTKLGVQIFYVEVDGCTYELRDEDAGMLTMKSWITATTDSDFAQRPGGTGQPNHPHQCSLGQ